MFETESDPPIIYRQEVVAPIFHLLDAGESAVIAGVSSMGKSRLVQFLLRQDVRQHYLGDAADTTLLAWADCNRMAEISEWGLYELILTALVEAVGTHPGAEAVRQQLNQLRREAIVEHNALLAQRHLELAVRMVCQEHGLRVCLLVDEFDETFRTLPAQALANLRALRDANKYWLTFVLFLRHHPAHLRHPEECEGFYELISRSILGLKPYTDEDARHILIQLQARRGQQILDLSEEIVAELLRLSGGHPGLLGALVDGLINSQPLGIGWQEWAQRLDNVHEELRKLWTGLRVDERQALNRLALGTSTGFRERESLLLKGLIRQEDRQNFAFFTPLLRDFAATQPPNGGDLWVDIQSGAIYVNGKLCETLTAREFDLFRLLYEHTGEICEIDQIIAHLYPDYKKDKKSSVFNNTITALVGRVRKKIEPNAGPPQYLLNVKGRGYKLVTTPGASV